MGNQALKKSKKAQSISIESNHHSLVNDGVNHQIVVEIIEKEINFICGYAINPQALIDKINIDDSLETLLILATAVESEEYRDDIIQIALGYNLEDVFVPVLEQCYETVSKYLRRLLENAAHELLKSIKSYEFKITKLLLNILIFINNLLDGSRIMACKFQLKNCVKSILIYLNDENFLINSINFAEIGAYHKNPFKEDFSELLMITLHSLSRVSDRFTKDFEELKLVVHVFKYINIMKIYKRYDKIMRAYLVLANIMTERDIQVCNNIEQIIDSIAKLLTTLAKSISKGKSVERKRPSITDDQINGNNSKVAIIMDKSDFEWNLVEIFQDLYSLATHDSIKTKIYEKCNSKHELNKVIYNGNEIEKSKAIKLLWQLCFNESIADTVSKDHKLVEYITRLSNERNLKNERLRRNCHGLIWLLTKCSKSQALEYSRQETHLNDPFLMISYEMESKEFCLKLKESLEGCGYRVWLNADLSNLRFDMPTSEIANCVCALVCVTERYKRTNFCREEAQLLLNKPHIPLVLEPNFHHDGWIKKLFLSFNLCDFSTQSYSDAIEHLNQTVKPFFDGTYALKQTRIAAPLTRIHTNHSFFNSNRLSFSSNIPYIDSDTVSNDHIMIRQTSLVVQANTIDEGQVDPLNWQYSDVVKWSSEHNLQEEFGEFLHNFNGRTLKFLYLVKKEAPEYFYRTISQNNKLAFDVVAKFVHALDDVYGKTSI